MRNREGGKDRGILRLVLTPSRVYPLTAVEWPIMAMCLKHCSVLTQVMHLCTWLPTFSLICTTGPHRVMIQLQGQCWAYLCLAYLCTTAPNLQSTITPWIQTMHFPEPPTWRVQQQTLHKLVPAVKPQQEVVWELHRRYSSWQWVSWRIAHTYSPTPAVIIVSLGNNSRLTPSKASGLSWPRMDGTHAKPSKRKGSHYDWPKKGILKF